jgi:hypothetical protein
MFFELFFHGMSLAQAAGEPQAPNWQAAGKDFIAGMRGFHPAAENGKKKMKR